MESSRHLEKLSQESLIILDGAMGTLLQNLELSDAEVTLNGSGPHHGCNELLSLTRGDLIYEIHCDYLDAGAHIIETNTFGANRFSLSEYHLEEYVYDLNLAAAEIARAAVESMEGGQMAFVAGVVGPTGKMASFSPRVDDLTYREVTFDDFVEVYKEQIEPLIDGGVDILLIETVFDTLVAKAALFAAYEVMEERGVEIPVMVSVTISDKSRRTLSGQTLSAFVDTLAAYPLFSLGLNCSTGAEEMLPLIEELARLSPFRISAHPNAGFPDHSGLYRQTPAEFATLLAPILERGLLNIVGGCCGTTPDHIAALKAVAQKGRVRVLPPFDEELKLSGLESLKRTTPFIVVGERTNVAGSRRFARLIRQKNYSAALEIAKGQIEQGAQVIDICMDDPLLEGADEMVTFLRLCAAEPEISSIPFMLDSSQWSVIEAGLKEVQGRCVVNSISLKEGEELFLERARHIARMGGAIMVMLFDEEGQADTYERKCEVAQRSYELLIGHNICPPSSIIIDPNVLTIATGIDEHDTYGRDFIKAVAWIKTNLPHVTVSGGVSNLSFAFRGNNPLRQAIHAVFLEEAALDMAIIDPASPLALDLFPPQVVATIRSLILAEGELAKHREELISLAMEAIERESGPTEKLAWRTLPLEERLAEALVRGEEKFLEEDLSTESPLSPVELIEGPLLEGMKRVGHLFGEGRLFLPQVVRSARVMKRAVEILKPRLTEGQGEVANHAGVVLLATVKGDVHDIGKNILALVLECNNFRVVDLGVMVPPEEILAIAVEEKADLVGLSGLITPSLVEMGRVCTLFQEAALKIPLLIGGATTSQEHTALRLAPLYDYVIHADDASSGVMAALALTGKGGERFMEERQSHYRKIAQELARAPEELLSYPEALKRRYIKKEVSPAPKSGGVFTVKGTPLAEVLPLVNWRMVAAAWRVSGQSEEGIRVIEEAKGLLEEERIYSLLEASLAAVVGIFKAKAINEHSFKIFDGEGGERAFSFLRSQKSDSAGVCRSLADYVHPLKEDWVGMFVATAGLEIQGYIEELRSAGDDYKALLLAMVSDRLAEAFSAYLEKQIEEQWWGAPVIRPAIGYPSAPDHAQKGQVFELLKARETIGVALSDNYAMIPTASVCGLYFVGEGLSYFDIKRVGEDQKRDNSAWRDELELWL